jgi:magnesium chelatase family protein
VTVAFQGIEARRVDIEVQFTRGEVKFFIVGMGDKAISESRERVRTAFSGLGLSLPSRRIIANLAPADLPKEGSHYDLPIALAIMVGMSVIPPVDVLPRAAGHVRSGWPGPSPTWRGPTASAGSTSPRR